MNKIVKAHIFILMANLIYAGNYSIAKTVMPEFIQSFGFVFIRVTVALCVFFIICQFIIREKVDTKDIGRLALCGLFGVACNQLLFFKGLDLTFPINAALIMVTTPIIVLVLSAIFLKEKMPFLKILGVALGVSGVILIILQSGEKISFGANSAFGDLFVFLNATSYAFYLVLVKPLMKKYHPITIMKWIFFFGAFAVIPIGFHQFSEINWASFTQGAWLGLLYVVIGTTILAYLFNALGLKTVNPSVVSIYIYLQPFTAGLIAFLFGFGVFTWIHLLAALLIFSGVYLVSRNYGDKKLSLT